MKKELNKAGHHQMYSQHTSSAEICHAQCSWSSVNQKPVVINKMCAPITMAVKPFTKAQEEVIL